MKSHLRIGLRRIVVVERERRMVRAVEVPFLRVRCGAQIGWTDHVPDDGDADMRCTACVVDTKLGKGRAAGRQRDNERVMVGAIARTNVEIR